METYYLKLRGFLRSFAIRAGMPEKQWRQRILDDVCPGAAGFDFRLIVSNGSERLIEIVGCRLILVCSEDRTRKDTLFVTKVHPRWGGGAAGVHSPASLALLAGPNAKQRSPVSTLFEAALPEQLRASSAVAWIGELTDLGDEGLKVQLLHRKAELESLCDGADLEVAAWRALAQLLGGRATLGEALDAALATEQPLRTFVDWMGRWLPSQSLSPSASFARQLTGPIGPTCRESEDRVERESSADALPNPAAGAAWLTPARDANRHIDPGESALDLRGQPARATGAELGAGQQSVDPYASTNPFSSMSRTATRWVGMGQALVPVRAAGRMLQSRWSSFFRHPPGRFEGAFWPEGIHADFVRVHPVGIQRHVAAMIERLRCGGGSLAAVAPRRCGKSTLAAYLAALDGSHQLVVAATIDASALAGVSGERGEEFWRVVANQVAERFGFPLAEFPDAVGAAMSAIAQARQFAAADAMRSVVIIVDDAECLFHEPSSQQSLREAFRRALDHDWSVSEVNEVAVGFVLLGSTSLLSALGSQLVERLRPFDGGRLAALDVASLLNAIGGRTFSISPEAISQLAEAAENLSVLRDLFEASMRGAQQRHATSVSSEDVHRAETALVAELAAGRASGLAYRLTASLVDCCQVSSELVMARLAVAATWAKARRQGASDERLLLQSCAQDLAEWSRVSFHDELQRMVFEPETLIEHVRALRRAGVLDGLDISSRLREAHLLQVSTEPPLEEETFRAGLGAAAELQVVPPAVLEPIAFGANAKVFRFTANGERLAYREVRRASNLETRRFSDRLRALRVLQKASRSRAPGSEYVFDLRAVGLRFDQPNLAVQIYHWVEGEDLSSRVGALAPVAVIEIGRRLARALQWLHDLDVLIFELRPEHVILEARSVRPVIIDLGLARLGSVGADSAGQGWSQAADVWALGRLLLKLLSSDLQLAELNELLAAMCDADPAARPRARDVARRFDELRAKGVAEQTSRESYQREVLDVAQRDFRFGYYRDLVEKFRPSFEASRMGLYPSPIQRATRAADFVNQLIEAWSSERFGRDGQLSLGGAKHKNHATGSRLAVPEVAFLHLLRTYRSHGGRGTLAEQVEHRYGKSSLAELRNLSVTGARLVARELGLATLPLIVAAFFDSGVRHGSGDAQAGVRSRP